MVCGVSGVAKSTVGAKLAHKLDTQFLDADDHHPMENIDHMRSGLPLTDHMRVGWLDAVCRAIQSEHEEQVIVACSALKKKHRDVFRAHFEQCYFVLLDVSKDVLRTRMAARTAHFMPASLLDSQLATLERPDVKERDVSLMDGTLPVEELMTMLAKFGSRHS
ncbi:gluconokinase [Maritalea sp. S77]|uniref:gluconokinase n=1 Tax=Maritalea sp. S77 TaxID=3415125 RepID=UPI003C7CA96D